MAVSAGNLMVGPGRIRTAPFGTDDALIVAGTAPAWSADWTDVGMTDDGVNMTIAKSYENHTVDQVADWVASTITERNAQLETNLAEATLDNLKLALNGGTITLGEAGGWDKYEPETDLVSTQEDYIALAIEGIALDGRKRIVVIRKALNVDDVAFSFKKDEKTMFACSWAGHFVSEDIHPFVVYTQSALVTP